MVKRKLKMTFKNVKSLIYTAKKRFFLRKRLNLEAAKIKVLNF